MRLRSCGVRSCPARPSTRPEAETYRISAPVATHCGFSSSSATCERSLSASHRSSASRNATYRDPLDIRHPRFRAADGPSWCDASTRSRGSRILAATARVASADPSSTTISSRSHSDCASTDPMAPRTKADALKAAITTVTIGMRSARGSPPEQYKNDRSPQHEIRVSAARPFRSYRSGLLCHWNEAGTLERIRTAARRRRPADRCRHG